ncbi:MAG TPA: carbohydrate ABC transporter permease [Chloroflexota bacterium]|jgi:multiple sugar transport system permease protein|nr:carbohydrate ABC transporter permease [Chloroflexota bacterium]
MAAATSAPSAGARPARRPGLPWRGIVVHGVSLFYILWIALPFSWIVLTSLMTEAESMSVPPHWIPDYITFDNYLAFLNPALLGAKRLVGGGAAMGAPRALLNSAVVAFVVAILNMLIGSFAGYAFARLEFRGSATLLMLYLATRMVPALAIMVSLYLIFQALGLIDTLLVLILAYLTFTIPYSVWIMASYLRTIPRDLEDAARVDGCNWINMMFRVFLPVASPGLVACAMFAFMSSWGEFLYALLFTSTLNSKTMPIIVAGFVTDNDTAPTLMNAGGVLAVIPPLVLALLFQRLIVSGIAAGAVKG